MAQTRLVAPVDWPCWRTLVKQRVIYLYYFLNFPHQQQREFWRLRRRGKWCPLVQRLVSFVPRERGHLSHYPCLPLSRGLLSLLSSVRFSSSFRNQAVLWEVKKRRSMNNPKPLWLWQLLQVFTMEERKKIRKRMSTILY